MKPAIVVDIVFGIWRDGDRNKRMGYLENEFIA